MTDSLFLNLDSHFEQAKFRLQSNVSPGAGIESGQLQTRRRNVDSARSVFRPGASRTAGQVDAHVETQSSRFRVVADRIAAAPVRHDPLPRTRLVGNELFTALSHAKSDRSCLCWAGVDPKLDGARQHPFGHVTSSDRQIKDQNTIK